MSWADDIELHDAVGTPDAFKKRYGEAAARAGKELGVDPDVILAQWGHETGWGRSVVPGTNNLGNIKGKGVSAKDNMTGSTDQYQKFASPEAFADRYVELVKTNYPRAVGAGSDPKKFALGLHGYAEDPHYAKKLVNASSAVSASSPKKTDAPADDWASGIDLKPLGAVSDDDFKAAPAAKPAAAQPQPSFADNAKRGLGLGVRNIATGLTSPFTAAGDLLNAGVNAGISGVNALAGTNIPGLQSPSAVTQNALSGAGLPVASTPLERVTGDIQSGAVSALTGAGAAGSAAKLATNPVVRNTLSALGENAALQGASGATSAAASGVTRELGGGPLAQAIAGIAGGVGPLIGPTIAQAAASSDKATRNAAVLLRDALKENSPEKWNAARATMTAADQAKIPLLGPEAFPQGSKVGQLAEEVASKPASKNALQDYTAGRDQATEVASRNAVSNIGKPVGAQTASNQAQEAADTAVRNAQEARTEAAGPNYRAQKASDKEAIDLHEQLDTLPDKIADLTASANSATQVAGKLHAFTNEQIQAANRTIRRGLGYAGSVKAGRNLAAADQGKAGTYEAINRARVFRAQIDNSQRLMEAKADQLAQKNLPQTQAKVNQFLGALDSEIKVAGNTQEGKILQNYRDKIAPNGEALVLPSQLESVYKDVRNTVAQGKALHATAADKTAAGVLGGHVKNLDALIQDVSPMIKAGREIYAKLSDELVNPLIKGPVGKIAGRGAENTKEAVTSRTMSELSGKGATPERIATIADVLGTVDKEAFPNLVRAHLEDKLNKAFKTQRGAAQGTAGVKFRDALEGSPQERTNLRTMIQKTAEAQGRDPTKVYEGFGRLLDVLDATGRVASPRRAGLNAAADTIEHESSAPIEIIMHPKTSVAKGIVSFAKDARLRKSYAKLAETFTGKDSLDKMARLAVTDPRGANYLPLVQSILRGTAAPKDDGDDE